MSDAKLRRLREWFASFHRHHEGLPLPVILDAVDRLLAEPEPLSDACKAPSGCCVAIASTDGSWCPQGCIPATGIHAWRNARGVLRRETIEEEIARLYGQDGRR